MRRRLTGLNFPIFLGIGGGGAVWTIEKGEKARATGALRFLEDRRVLYDPYDVEIPQACVMSVKEIRMYLRSLIEQCQSSELRDPLRAIQAACRQFLTETEELGSRGGHIIDVVGGGADSWLFNQALGALRARVGTSVAIIVQTFDIEVDEHLVPIMPPPVDEDNADSPESKAY